MERRNKKTKSVGNGEGTLYYSEVLKCWVYQYYDTSNKRKTMKQRKNETVKDFKARVSETMVLISKKEMTPLRILYLNILSKNSMMVLQKVVDIKEIKTLLSKLKNVVAILLISQFKKSH